MRTKAAKKSAWFALLIPLALLEMYLSTAFFPVRWQRAIDHQLSDIFPKSSDWTPVTHPLLSDEIESVLREQVGIRIALYVFTLALLISNAWLIRRVSKVADSMKAIWRDLSGKPTNRDLAIQTEV
jgi:hypothetical protein